MIEDVYKAAANRYDSGMEYARAGRSGILLPAYRWASGTISANSRHCRAARR